MAACICHIATWYRNGRAEPMPKRIGREKQPENTLRSALTGQIWRTGLLFQRKFSPCRLTDRPTGAGHRTKCCNEQTHKTGPPHHDARDVGEGQAYTYNKKCSPKKLSYGTMVPQVVFPRLSLEIERAKSFSRQKIKRPHHVMRGRRHAPLDIDAAVPKVWKIFGLAITARRRRADLTSQLVATLDARRPSHPPPPQSLPSITVCPLGVPQDLEVRIAMKPGTFRDQGCRPCCAILKIAVKQPRRPGPSRACQGQDIEPKDSSDIR